MNRNQTFFKTLNIIFSTILGFSVFSGVTYACNPCNQGDTRTNPTSGEPEVCVSCGAQTACRYADWPYTEDVNCTVQANHNIYPTAVCDASCGGPRGYNKWTSAGSPPPPAPSCTGVSAPVTQFNQDTGNFTVQANGVANTNEVWFYIWSLLNDTDDRVAIRAADAGGGVFRVTDQLQIHPTDQTNTMIVADAYIGGPAGVGRFCGSLVGGIRKATPPRATLYSPSDPTGGDVRDVSVVIRDDINSALNPVQISASARDEFPGTAYNGITSLQALRRPCNPGTGNCAEYGGGWSNIPATSTNCTAGNESCVSVLQPWTPIMGDLINASRWQVVVNATDRSNYRCSGNAYTGWTNFFQEPWVRCDRGSQVYDRMTVNLNILPKGYIPTDSVRVGPNTQNSRTITASVGEIISLNAIGTDDDRDNSVGNNGVSVITLHTYSLSTGYRNIASFNCGGNLSTCTFTNAQWDTSTYSPGSYQLYMKAFDNYHGCNYDATEGSWSSQNLPNFMRCDRNAGGGFATANDVITVNLTAPARTVSGTTFTTSDGCIAVGGPIPQPGTVRLNTYAGALSGGNWSVSGIPDGTSITQVSANVVAGAENYTLSCVRTPAGNFSSGGAGYINLPASVAHNITANVNSGWSLGFIPSPPTAWISSYDGDIFSNGGINMTLPSIVAPGFERFVITDNDNAFGSGFFHSNDTVSVSPSDSINEGGTRNFYVADAADSATMNLWPTGYRTEAPSSCTANLQPAGMNSLQNNTCYTMTSANFNSWNGTGAGTASYNVTSNNSVAVVYVGSASDTPIVINRGISSTNATKRVVFVFLPGVSISPDVGGNGTSAQVNIQAGIMTFREKDIVVPARGGGNADTTLYVQGMLASGRSASFNRNRITTNNIPSTIVQYSTQLLRDLTAQERAAATSNSTGLFVNNVSWYYGN